MNTNIYKVTEVNINGCGGDCYEYVSATRKLTKEEEIDFSDILKYVKHAMINNDFCTWDMVEEAVKNFNIKHDNVQLNMCGSPFEREFKF